MNKSVDDWLLGHKTRAVRTKDSGGFLLVLKKSPPLRPGYGLANLRTAALKQPEVMVKITRRKSNACNGLKGIRNHLDYISRNGEVEVENQDGEKLNGKKALRNQTKDWQKLGIPENEKSCEALNIVLSMPAGMPPQAVKNASSESLPPNSFRVTSTRLRCIQTVNALSWCNQKRRKFCTAFHVKTWLCRQSSQRAG